MTVEEQIIDVTVVEDEITLNVYGGASPVSVATVASDLSDHEGLTTTAHGGIVADSDSRLTDARTPTAHAASHATGEDDPIAAADIGAEPTITGGTSTQVWNGLKSFVAGVWLDVAQTWTAVQTFSAGAIIDRTIEMEDTEASDQGVIYKDSTPFIHNFHHPTGSSATPKGFNNFFGTTVGNFTMGQYATSSNHGSYNTGLGNNVLAALNNGQYNVGIGTGVFPKLTDGVGNVAIGHSPGFNMVDGSYNFALGHASQFYSVSGTYNVSIGPYTLHRAQSGGNNIAIGANALSNYGLSTVNSIENNVAIGSHAGEKLAESQTGSIFIGGYAGQNAAESYRLYIDPSSTTTPLIYGEFDNRMIRINGDFDATGSATISENLVLESPAVPSSASDTGIAGQISWDDDFVYVCVAADTWKRVLIDTW